MIGLSLFTSFLTRDTSSKGLTSVQLHSYIFAGLHLLNHGVTMELLVNTLPSVIWVEFLVGFGKAA
jgi:hypothetical protein